MNGTCNSQQLDILHLSRYCIVEKLLICTQITFFLYSIFSSLDDTVLHKHFPCIGLFFCRKVGDKVQPSGISVRVLEMIITLVSFSPYGKSVAKVYNTNSKISTQISPQASSHRYTFEFRYTLLQQEADDTSIIKHHNTYVSGGVCQSTYNNRPGLKIANHEHTSVEQNHRSENISAQIYFIEETRLKSLSYRYLTFLRDQFTRFYFTLSDPVYCRMSAIVYNSNDQNKTRYITRVQFVERK